jgi:chorismate mutase
MSLESLRAKLDVVDAELIEVLARRAGVVAEIWREEEYQRGK